MPRAYETFRNKVIDIIRTNTPIAAGLCLDEMMSDDKCKNPHVVLITGFRKACFPNKADCADYIKIQNTWGKDWQETHADGWVDARNFFQYLPQGTDTLSWYAIRKPADSHAR